MQWSREGTSLSGKKMWLEISPDEVRGMMEEVDE
jgi:hypothetical protein